MSEEELAQLWATVFHARAILNDAGLGVRLGHDDLLRMVGDLLAVVERLRCSYDAQYSHLRQARALLREMTDAAPLANPGHGQDWHAVSQDVLLRAATFLLRTAQHDQGC